MAFHLPNDPYPPVVGNAGWIEEEEEEAPEEQVEAIPVESDPSEGEASDDDPSEDEQEGNPPISDDEESELEEEVINPRHPVRGRDGPLPRPIRQEDAPAWANDLRRWSLEQGQIPPYGMDRSFFNVREGTSADRALPVIIRRVANLDAHARATSSQLMSVGADTQVTAARFQRLDADHDLTKEIVQNLQAELAGARAEVRELRYRVDELEQRVRSVKRGAGESSSHAQTPQDHATP